MLAAIQPAFQTVTDAVGPGHPGADEDCRPRWPTSALRCSWPVALRDRPRWAVVGAARDPPPPGGHRRQRLVGPVRVDLHAVRRWPRSSARSTGATGWPRRSLAVALMTKPQALPFLLPFAAWFWATRRLARARSGPALIGAAVIVVLWLPFIPAGGPANYLENLAEYQDDIFTILSLRAWNVWWLVQDARAPAATSSPTTCAFLGPLTLPPRRLRAHRAARDRRRSSRSCATRGRGRSSWAWPRRRSSRSAS